MSTVTNHIRTEETNSNLATPVAGGSFELPFAIQASGGPVAEHFERILTSVEMLLDMVTSAGVIFGTAVASAKWSVAPHRSIAQVALIALGFGIFMVLMLDREGAYRGANSLLRVRETEYLLRICAQAYIVTTALISLGEWPISFRTLNFITLILCVALLIEKHLVYVVVRQLHGKGIGVRRVVIAGAGYTGRRVYSALVRSPKLGLKPVALIDENALLDGTRIYASSYKRHRWLPVSSVSFLGLDLRRFSDCMLILSIPSLSREKFVALATAAADAKLKFAFVPSHHVPTDLWVEHSDIDGLLLDCFSAPPRRALYELSKRVFDMVFSTTALLVLIPIWALIAALVRYQSAGSVFFKQTRVGKNGVPFDCYKFRSMYSTAPPYSPSPKESDDPRITPIGRFLRRTSLDELPQLLNVLKGDMSLVGPRPEMPFLVESYSLRHWQRLQVLPGITGLWQISADRDLHIHENIEYDLYYIRHRSFFVDLAILLHTVFFAMRGI